MAGDRWDFGIISSSLGRRNGIETNFIKQISLKRALSPTHAYSLTLGGSFPFVVQETETELSLLNFPLSLSVFLSRNSRHRPPFPIPFHRRSCTPILELRRATFFPPVLLQLPFETVVRSRAEGASRVQQGTESGARGARLRRHVRRMQLLPDRHGPREIRRG